MAGIFTLVLCGIIGSCIYSLAMLYWRGRGLAVPGKVGIVYSLVSPQSSLHFVLPGIRLFHPVYLHVFGLTDTHVVVDELFNKMGVDHFALVSPSNVSFVTRSVDCFQLHVLNCGNRD